MAKVKDIAVQIRGVSYHPEDLHDNLDEDSVVLLRANNIKDGKLILDDVVYVSKSKVAEQQYLQTGDILICASSGSKELVGKAAFVDSVKNPMTFGAFCKVVRPQPEYSEYLGHYFNSPVYRRKISALSAGANINNIKNEHIDNLDIQLVDEKERREIITILNELNMLISLRKQQLFKLDELVKARFVEMFGDCKTNPKNWKTKALEKIANVGSSKRVFVEELQDSGIPFYRGTEIGALAEKKAVIPALFITEEHYKQLCETTGKPQKGDLLMPSICPDGRIWIVDTGEPFYFKDGRVLWVHLTSANYNSVFLLYTLKDRIMTDYASIASGTTFAELKIFALKKCKIFDVPLELQNQFANFVERVDQQKQTVQQSLEKLELMKKALMQEYFG